MVLALVSAQGGCRVDNPRFGQDLSAQSSAEQTNSDDTTTRKDTNHTKTAAATTEQTAEQTTEQTTGRTTEQTTQPTTSSKENTASTTLSSSASQDTTTDIDYPKKWNVILPTPGQNLSLPDHCKRGAKGCFVFKDPNQTVIESETPGYPGMKLKLANLGPPPPPSAFEQSPVRDGVRLNGSTSRIESTGPFPRYAGQNFGIEIWYRNDTSPTYNELQVMLFQVLETFWISANPHTGDLSCGLPLSSTVTETIHQTPTQLGDTTPDRLRYVSCFIHNGDAYLYTNETVQSKAIGDRNRPFQVERDVTDKPYALGGWVTGNSASNIFQRFQGTIYMARIWNNMQYMQTSMSAELEARHLDPVKLKALPLSTP